MLIVVVITDRESVEPESVLYRTGSKHASSTANRRQYRKSCDAMKDTRRLNIQQSLPRDYSHRPSAAADNEDLYCPMNGVRVEGRERLPVVNNRSGKLQRVCSDETLSLQSHSRRLQQPHRETPTHTDRRLLAMDVATGSTIRGSRGDRDRHRGTVVPQSVQNTSSRHRREVVPQSLEKTSSRKGRQIVASDRPDLLRTWKDEEDRSAWNCISPLTHGTVDRSGVHHSCPQDDKLLRHPHASPNEALSGTFLAVTQSPQSDASPASQYPTAPAASPVTVNSAVFNPPPRALVSSTPTTVCPTTASVPSQPLMMDLRSNPDSGYGSKIYCYHGTGPVVDPVPSSQEHHLISPVKTETNLQSSRPAIDRIQSGLEHHLMSPIHTDANPQSLVCCSYPDVVVDQPLSHSGQVLAATTLPQTIFDPNLSCGHQRCHSDAGSLPPNLDLRTYSETNLVVSPRRGRSRVPIELADENSVVEVFSPTSPVSLDSVDFVTGKVSDCTLSSPTDNSPNTSTNNSPNAALPLAGSYPDVPQETKCISSPCHGSADVQLYCYVNSVSGACNEPLGSRSLGTITEDVGQAGRECDSYRKTDNFCRSPTSAGSILDHTSDTFNNAEAIDNMLRCQMVHGAPARSRLPIGRSTIV